MSGEMGGPLPAPLGAESLWGSAVLRAPWPGSRVHPRPGSSPGLLARARGFTLIELLVVMLLIVIGTVGVGLGGSESRAVQQEAARLALLVRTARQESILEGEVYAVEFSSGGYQFLVLDNRKGQFETVSSDEILRPRRLPAGMSIRSITINGADAGNRPELILLPTGELPAFDIVLARGSTSWRVEGTAEGVIRAVQSRA